MYKFIKIKDPTNEHDVVDVNVRVTNSDITWPELTEVYVHFLRACGYVVGEGHFVEDRALDEYVATRTQQTVETLMSALVSAGKLNELLVHPDAFIREMAQKAFSANKDKLL